MENSQSIRSKEWIATGFLTLLDKYNYDEITITEISYEANITRKTFYRHFSSKKEVIMFQINNLLKKYYENIDIEKSDISKLSISFFEFWRENNSFLTVLEKNKVFHLLLDSFIEFFRINLINDEAFSENKAHIDYHIYFHSAGLWHILKIWVINNFSDKEIAQIYSDILQDKEIIKI